MKKKLFSIALAAASVCSLVACNSSQGPTIEPEAKPEKVEANITFEDEKFDFALVSTGRGGADQSNLSLTDYNGSKALYVENVSGKKMYVGFELDALLGDKVADIKTIQMDIGVASPSGEFVPCSGKLYAYPGEDKLEKEAGNWSVYLATENPKTVFFNVGELGLTNGNGNYIVLSKEEDAGSTLSNVYIDNIAFIDSEGNVIAADTSAVFTPVDGFLKEEIATPSGGVAIEYEETYGDDWSQHGFIEPGVISQFAGQDVTITYTVGYVPDADYYLFGPMDSSSGWNKFASEEKYNYFLDVDFSNDEPVEGKPWHLQHDGFFVIDDITNTTISYTLSAERVDKIIENGMGMGAQTAGVYCYTCVIAPAGATAGTTFEFAGDYQGDWGQDGLITAEDLAAFAGKDVTVSYSVNCSPGFDYYLFGIMDASSWDKLADEGAGRNGYVGVEFAGEAAEGQQWHLQNDGFLVIDDPAISEIKVTISAECVDSIIANGVGLAGQTYGVTAYSATIN